MDEAEQNEIYRPYIDYAKRLGITLGVGENYFAPKRPITEQQLRTMLERANGIEPIYPLSYDTPLYKILSADTFISYLPIVTIFSLARASKSSCDF